MNTTTDKESPHGELQHPNERVQKILTKLELVGLVLLWMFVIAGWLLVACAILGL